METKACIEKSNQEVSRIRVQSQVPSNHSGSSHAVFVLKDQTFVGRVVKDGAGLHERSRLQGGSEDSSAQPSSEKGRRHRPGNPR